MRVALVLAAVVLSGVLPLAPATADGEVMVSVDGSAWAPQISTPLFDPAERWVPGDVRTAAFWVGNRAGSAGDVAVAVRAGAGADPVLGRDVRIEARLGSGAWADLPIGGGRQALSGTLDPGGEQRVEVRAAFAPASGNPTQVRRFPLEFEVALRQATTSVTPPVEDPGALPSTGGPGSWVLLVGLVLMLCGHLVVARLSRLPQEDDE